jgi:hypothetical protein
MTLALKQSWTERNPEFWAKVTSQQFVELVNEQRQGRCAHNRRDLTPEMAVQP